MTRQEYIDHLQATIRECSRRIASLERCNYFDNIANDDSLEYISLVDLKTAKETELKKLFILDTLNS